MKFRYVTWTCDRCARSETVTEPDPPDGWERVGIGLSKDLCGDCLMEFEGVHDRMRELEAEFWEGSVI